MIRAVGGTLISSPQTDDALRALGARAATRGDRVYVRSDLRSADDTLAHEAVHVLQRERSGRGQKTRDPHVDPDGAAEREAHRESKALLQGGTPRVRERVPYDAVQLELDAATDFQPGTAPGISSLDDARKDSEWVEQDIANYAVSEKPPWTFTLLYEDGSRLEIPLTKMSFAPAGGATVTFFRRHRKTGRLVPFQIDALDPGFRAPSRASGEDTLLARVPVRFDPKLTPLVISYLNAAQMLFLGMGILKVMELQLMNPVTLGFGEIGAAGAARSGAARTLAARAAAGGTAAFDVTRAAEGLLAQTAEIASPGAKMIRGGTILSKMLGPSAPQKLQVMLEFFKRIGFAIGKQGVVQEADAFVIYSEDSRYAFRFLKATGEIVYGKFDTGTFGYVWRALQ